MTDEKKGFRAFLARKGVTLSPKVYFVDAMGSMALGLFATLLIGTIFKTLFGFATEIPYADYAAGAGSLLADFLYRLTYYAQGATGIVLGIAVAYALKAPPLVLFSAGVVGMCGNALPYLYEGKNITAGPLGAFLCVLFAAELGKMVSKETKVDILVTPVVTIGSGVLLASLICPAVSIGVYWIGYFIAVATDAAPFLMGVVLSVVIGVILTLPISSAAICIMFGVSGLAGGAAAVGCCAQMIGFAVISFRENRWGGVVAQGLGTSMLQMGNIVKHPAIWIAPTLAAAVTGPMATCLFRLECDAAFAGMGTCGLVGPIGIFSSMGFGLSSILGTLLLCFVLPAVLSLVFNEILRKIGWVKTGDMALDL